MILAKYDRFLCGWGVSVTNAAHLDCFSLNVVHKVLVFKSTCMDFRHFLCNFFDYIRPIINCLIVLSLL